MEIVFVSLICAILLFALVGLIASIRYLASLATTTPPRQPNNQIPQPNLQSDVLAARRLIEHLHLQKLISDAQFSRLGHFLEQQFPTEVSQSPYQSHLSIPLSIEPESQLYFKDAPYSEGLHSAEPERPQALNSMGADRGIAAGRNDLEPSPIPSATSSVPVADASASSASIVHAEALSAATARNLDLVTAELVGGVNIAPWDRPDPPAPLPRRSIGEMVAGFMQENNMRWGELASGILIVLSAIGLVVSLRNELNQRIPYFSSLLFLLITAAIIGAGIYTLQRWKLRDTSRGTLIIGLLLIPINFVAASVLSSGENRRELTDPIFWVAVVTGLIAFGFLSWYGTRFLIRKFNLGLAASLTGCGAAGLVYHRLSENSSLSSSSPSIALALIPVGFLTLWGANFLQRRTWNRTHLSPSSANRWLIQSGIAGFAALAAGSLWLVQSKTILFTTVALSPLPITLACMLAWIGFSIQAQRYAQSSSYWRMLGSTLLVLGVFLVSLFWLGSLANPLVFVIDSLLIGLAVAAFSLLRGYSDLMPMAWSALALAGLAGLNLGTGKLAYDQWVEPGQIRDAVFNGKSGIWLLICGLLASGLQSVWSMRFAAGLGSQFRRSGLVSGCILILFGSTIAMIASLLNRNSYFDSMTASFLALIAGLGATVISVIKNRRRDLLDATDRQSAFIESLPAVKLAVLALVLLFIGLGHAFFWNPTFADGLARLTKCREATWAWILAVHGLVFAVASRIDKPGADNDLLIYGSGLSLIIATISAIVIVPLHSGNSTAVLLVVTLAWFVIGLTLLRNGKYCIEATHDAAVPFAASTGVLTSIAAAEWIMPPAWGDHFGTRHVMIQAMVLSGWAVLWTALAILLPRFAKMRWLVAAIPRVEQVVMPHVVALTGGLLIGALSDASANELFSNYYHTSLQPNLNWVFGAVVAMWIAVSFMMLQHPSWIKGMTLVGLWFLSWGLVAVQFESTRSVASALRWLIPGAGLVLAIVVGQRRRWLPAWVATRRSMRMRGRSWWHRRLTQRLIDFAVLIGVVVALLISTITISQVMLNGQLALGGPLKGSFFATDKLISFGLPLVLAVSMLLSYAVSERRPYLAGVGSILFQYLVILATVLFVISASTAKSSFASEYFIKVLHSSAIGMTIFGFAWYCFRERIHGREIRPTAGNELRSRLVAEHLSASSLESPAAMSPELPAAPFTSSDLSMLRVRPLEVHTLINGTLLTALASVVIVQYFLYPNRAAGWLSSIGNLTGLLSLVGFAWLTFLVGLPRVSVRSAAGRMWLIAWLGLILVGFLAAASEHFVRPFQPRLSFQVVSWGFIALGGLLLGCSWHSRLKAYSKPAEVRSDSIANSTHESPLEPDQLTRFGALTALKDEQLKFPFVATMMASLVCAIRGLDTNLGWKYESIIQLVLIVGLVFAGGVVLRRAWLLFTSGLTAVIAAIVMDQRDLLPKGQPAWLNLSAIWLCLLGTGNVLTEYYLRSYRGQSLARRFSSFASAATFVSAIWIFSGSLIEMMIGRSGESCFQHWMGVLLFAAVFLLLFVFLWNPHRRLWTSSFAMATCGLAITIAILGRRPANEFTLVLAMFASSVAVVVWGVVWFSRGEWMPFLNRLGAPEFGPLQRSMQIQLPVVGVILSLGLVLLAGSGLLFGLDPRLHRMTAAAVPLVLASGLGLFSNAREHRWLQHGTLFLATLGLVFVSWAGLQTADVWRSPVQLLVRTLVVLAFAMFVYGGVLTQYLRASDNWLKTFREMSGLTCAAAIVCLTALIGHEWTTFDPVRGSGLAAIETWLVVAVGVGMVLGMIMIAIRPKHDPFSLSMEARQTYVYVSQVVLGGLFLHLCLAMPRLFQWGLKEYWPYLAMAVCFGGVGVSRLLERRNLKVLAQPLFNTAATIPVLTAIASFALSSKADGATLMLLAGMAYLSIGVMHDSMFGRILALVFGNLALCLFYGRFETFSFQSHPQLWLIPPAVSALIAAQLNRSLLNPSQLTGIRYFSAAVVYISSTSEIFISGIGDQLWPPIVLALLSVAGILAGILLQVRAFLYFGMLFLLMAMISMVSHAHRRFDHVWPWWAFGIAMGIGILVMFGLFEKRKNELKNFTNHLKEWDR